MSYAALYRGTKPIIRLASGSGGGTPYVRPSEWPDISNPTPSDCLVGLYGVADHDSNHVALRCNVSSGTYDVDWGDGNVSLNVTSDENAEHLYDYAAITSISPVNGVKPVTVIVTPSSGSGDLTAISLQQKHSQAGLPTGTFSVNWLDVTVKAPAATSLAIGGTVLVLHLLQQARIISHAVTNMSSMFNNCRSLQSVPLFNTAAVTNMSSMFRDCLSLQSVPLFNTAAVTNMSSMFQNCVSLQSVPLFNTAAVTNMSSMFNECFSLQSVPLFNTAAVTNMVGMFANCSSLQSVPLFDTAAVTNMTTMFNGCNSLQSIPQLDTATVSSAANIGNFTLNCRSLAKGRTNGIRFAISYNGCKLSRAALVDIFNGLGTASGSQTIDVRNNFGTASLDAADKLIAENKGWTVQDS